jgi:hypothetical protein
MRRGRLMSAPLTVRNAEIHTATVEIRTLTVSGRQVTQAVFRQLLEEHLVSLGDGTFRGTPWGWVNYHPSKDCKESEADHMHVVWQCGEELRRDICWSDDFHFHSDPVAPSSRELASHLLGTGWRPDPEDITTRTGQIQVKMGAGARYFYNPPHRVILCVAGHEMAARLEPAAQALLAVESELRNPYGFADERELLEAAERLRRRLEEQAGAVPSADYWEQKVLDELDVERVRRAALDQRWQDLMDLPQLFIAV